MNAHAEGQSDAVYAKFSKVSEESTVHAVRQKKALEMIKELESENAELKEAADRRSKVLHQSRSFINTYLQVPQLLSSFVCSLFISFPFRTFTLRLSVNLSLSPHLCL